MYVHLCVCVCTRGKRLTQSVNKLPLEERWAEEALENHSAIEEPARNSWRLAGHNEAATRRGERQKTRRETRRGETIVSSAAGALLGELFVGWGKAVGRRGNGGLLAAVHVFGANLRYLFRVTAAVTEAATVTETETETEPCQLVSCQQSSTVGTWLPHTHTHIHTHNIHGHGHVRLTLLSLAANSFTRFCCLHSK